MGLHSYMHVFMFTAALRLGSKDTQAVRCLYAMGYVALEMP